MKNRDGGINPNLVAWNAYVGYQFNENSSVRLDARNLLNRHNVISNGDWEYWDGHSTISLATLKNSRLL